MRFKDLANRAKRIVDERGGVESLKQDAMELKDIAKRPGRTGDKAKAAAEALKRPGARRRGEAEPSAPDAGRGEAGPSAPDAGAGAPPGGGPPPGA
jgi:hypothetical protein